MPVLKRKIPHYQPRMSQILFILLIMILFFPTFIKDVLAAPEKPKASSSLFIPITGEAAFEENDMEMIRQGDHNFLEGDFDKALPLYRKAFKLNPKNDNALVRQGDVFLRKGRYEEAEEAFRKAVQLNPKNPFARVGLADMLLEDCKHKEARDELAAALSINPKMAVAHTSLGDIFVDERKYDEALTEFKRSFELEPAQSYPDTYIGLGELYFQTKDYVKSRENFVIAQRKDPFDADGYVGEARALLRLGDPREAEMAIKRCMALLPDNLDAGIFLVKYYIGVNRKKEAEALLEKLEKKHPGDEELMIVRERLEGKEVD